MIENGLLSALRERLRSEIAYAIYVIAGREERANVASASVLGDGRVTAAFLLSTPSDRRETITEIRAYNAADELLVRENTDITNGAGVSGIYYRMFFSITGA